MDGEHTAALLPLTVPEVRRLGWWLMGGRCHHPISSSVGPSGGVRIKREHSGIIINAAPSRLLICSTTALIDCIYGGKRANLEGMKAYSLDLRQKILRACDQHLGSQPRIAALFGVSQSFVEKLLRRRRTTGQIAPCPHGGGRKAHCDEAALTCVRRLAHEQSDATLEELCVRMQAEQGLRVSVPTMSRSVTSLELPRKNSRSTPASGTPRASSRRVRPMGSGWRRLTSGA
jgi:transposase